MAKIDTSMIEGYADMSPEEKLSALESYEIDVKTSKEYTSLKTSFDKASSEVSEWKKKHHSLLTDEEKAKQAQESALSQMQDELNALRKEKLVSGHKVKYLAMGYDEELAEETAVALADGNLDVVFANQAKHLEAQTKKIKSDALKAYPVPPAGTGSAGTDYSAKIQDAMSRGDMASAAAYMRLMQTK